MTAPAFLIVMGVSGSGKTTVGRALAARLGWAFHDADEHHPAENVAKMARGIPLTDADRGPWLASLCALITRAMGAGECGVLACSALKQRYRDVLSIPGVRCVHLRGDIALIRARMEARAHFMPVALLESQFAALEAPLDAIVIDIEPPVDVQVEAIVAAAGLS